MAGATTTKEGRCGGAVKGLLVAGTASEAGKSAVTAGICRWLARRGVKVAPFKAQNMSLNSVVTRDGAEIGRAQAAQAAAAGIEPEAALNPVLRSSARAPAAPPRSTCASTTSPIWAWPGRRACR